ncbi:MAG TPA: oxygen-independent coproporphyrinogen III oxidase [Chryseosolibacter sp.]
MTSIEDQRALIKKYDVPVPRYTSYPTMPYWETENFSLEKWISAVKRSFNESNLTKGISLYIHLPFCESLCTYCACNTRITKNHKVEADYLRAIFKEWDLYKKVLGGIPQIRELHLGGGTPTFFSPDNLRSLIRYVLEETALHEDFEFSFEGHPNNTTEAHLQTLHELGFRRVSFGVQDLDERVQKTINRIQPFENLQRVTNLSRDIGYQSISYDLIYGLPFQTSASILNTIEKVLTLRPDRVSFYSYAHVPWIKPGQRGYEDADLPSDLVKRQLYETGRALLKAEGYEDVGMDHFALRHDSLYVAQQNGKLHRNFMGYTTSETDLLIGLGASAISDAKYAYAQNLKKVEDYSAAVANDTFAVFKGHSQTSQDLLLKKCILEIACEGKIRQENLLMVSEERVLQQLSIMNEEGIISANIDGFQVTEQGRAFVRNICSVFDFRMHDAQLQKHQTLFSKAI